MICRLKRPRLALVVVVLSAACTKNNVMQPSGTASVATPRPLQPVNGAAIRNIDQPVTLAVQNAVVTKTGGTTYTFEVATDSAFSSKVQTKEGVVEAQAGQTSVKLDVLAAAKDYYWHARAQSSGTSGVFGATYKFTVGPAIIISPPILLTPQDGAAKGARPTLTVANAARQGPAGPITYLFELAVNPAFGPIAISATVPEGPVETSFKPTTDLAANQTYYWRVTARDAANGVSSPPSTSRTFITSQAIDLSKVVYLKSPNVSAWPETGTLTIVEQDGSAAAGGPMCMSFTDPGWPDVPFFGDPKFGVFANQWYFANIGGIWYGGAGEWLYRGVGSCKAGQGTKSIGPDSGFGPPFSTWVPKPGELVGFMVSSVARAGMRSVDERTNVIVQPWYDSSLGTNLTPAIKR